MNRLSGVLVAVAALTLAGCGGNQAATPGQPKAVTTSPSTSANVQDATFEPFRNGSFEIKINSLAYGMQGIDADATAKAGGLSGYKPKNGQFIIFYAKATNRGGRISVNV